ncbi:MAG TPA: hypothetical protein VGV59_00525 [Pyrinomonadaceae bacterium]|nr:hypothetical protein [Pyrinomonadaceae bacterium]
MNSFKRIKWLVIGGWLVGTIQGRTFELGNVAMDALVELINEIKAARRRTLRSTHVIQPGH